ncbi:MAG TPA: AbrB/MazE/SpoVT family DNA-binding domain-containing protein [Dongiaceae bacterium]|nr:AbrB/MazE/SpoVT family DNA-binding domain-containing protein [Dongiaceae bacterium]
MIKRRVRLFRYGGSQAVRIPVGFDLPGDEAVLRKDGDRLILEAAPRRLLLQVLAQLSPITENLDTNNDPAPRAVEF